MRDESVTRIMNNFVAKLSKDGYTIDSQVFQEANSVAVIGTTLEGLTRVSLIVAYDNSAKKPQLSWFFQDFIDEDKALDLYLSAVRSKGFMVFGEEYRLSRGSGFRFHKDHS